MAKFAAACKALLRALDWLTGQLGWIAGGLTAVMMIAIMREVIGRYFFHAPSDWSLELSCYLLVGLAYLAAADTEVNEKHIRIDFIYERFRGRTKHAADILIPSIGLCWCVIVVWQGGRIAWHSLVTNARSAEILAMPLFPSQVMVPIGASLLGLILIGKIIKNIGLLRAGGK